MISSLIALTKLLLKKLLKLLLCCNTDSGSDLSLFSSTGVANSSDQEIKKATCNLSSVTTNDSPLLHGRKIRSFYLTASEGGFFYCLNLDAEPISDRTCCRGTGAEMYSTFEEWL